MKNSAAILAHLDNNFNDPVRDPLWKNIMLSHGFKKILSSLPLQKLNKIKQLGPTYHVYPGAVHTRLNHSIGVFHISKLILRQLLLISNCPLISKEEAESFLCASLLHDLGHFPYAHSLKELPLIDHEALTGEAILSQPLYGIIKKELKIDPVIAAAIVDKSITKDITPEISFFRNILSGVLDPDKLDYLNRDAYFCGVPYGVQDIDFIISNIIPDAQKGIAILEPGIPAVENILFSKYLMYRAVYWHKTVRCATAMVKKALFTGLMEDKINPDELYNQDDETLFLKYNSKKFKPFALFEKVSKREFYKIAVEIPFNNSNLKHQKLVSLNNRLLKEIEIIKYLQSKNISADEISVIIDIPEKINFEFDIPVIEESGCSKSLKPTVFDQPVIENFTNVIRNIRVFLPADILKQLLKAGNPGTELSAELKSLLEN